MRKFRTRSDGWWILHDILVGTPDEFNITGPMRGRCFARTDIQQTTGELPQEYVNDLKDSVVRYVIYSYETPIAWRRVADWRRDGSPVFEWVMPKVTYSVTTSKHQAKVREALASVSENVVSE